jgi:hypothetical protein
MTPKILSRTVVALMSSAAVLPAIAANGTELFGEPAPAAAAHHTVTITPNTKYVNVQGGDTVQFNVGDKTFAWNFDVARNISDFDLNDVAPPGVLDHAVTAYVAPDPQSAG